MSSSARSPRPAPAKSERYHHGDLRRALLDAARALAAEGGVEALTLREVARQAGVSAAAPYHHFSDKNDLLRAVATEAFERLAQRMTEAAQRTDDHVMRLEEIGLAYVEFAFAQPAEFRFMFRHELCLPPGVPDPLEQAGQAAYAVLLTAVEEAQRAGRLRSGTPGSELPTLGLTLWSAVHGLSTLLLESPLSKTSTPESGQHLARSVIGNVLRGVLA
ncbi:TetR/AcrR family transcriptional regulator [Deinococcus irradiatisoli]|uniref:TetR/AcrR family transcriptional regulator n=1 Tax=Deinococcus irradiatisoli TaxID=2202254 RepID=A0A2Z3JEK2_9DEIO|nr:TetR/AcrR family transcriptional regulator [Deinococcus irradiatisoli]AWN23593.1 TetR/AcrR family transcriptional regulator [Deinococcus irradiatisoli]